MEHHLVILVRFDILQPNLPIRSVRQRTWSASGCSPDSSDSPDMSWLSGTGCHSLNHFLKPKFMAHAGRILAECESLTILTVVSTWTECTWNMRKMTIKPASGNTCLTTSYNRWVFVGIRAPVSIIWYWGLACFSGTDTHILLDAQVWLHEILSRSACS